jgi:hypothetical protein
MGCVSLGTYETELMLEEEEEKERVQQKSTRELDV